MKKLIAVALLLAASGAIAQPSMDQYNKSCVMCHASGVANAPKTGDAEGWKPRLAKGMDVLVQSVNAGMNAMPPKGMCADCSSDDYIALIEYMSKPAE